MAYNFVNAQVQHPTHSNIPHTATSHTQQHPTHRTNLTLQNCHLFPELKQIGHNKFNP